MRKKALFYALVASSLFVGCLASCNMGSSSKVSSAISETFDEEKYNQIPDDETSKMVFNEFKKTHPDSTYEDFLSKGSISRDNQIIYSYKSGSIALDLNNSFVSKTININDITTEFKYFNNEWIKISEYKDFNHKTIRIYKLELNADGTFDSKEEITYDNSGNEQTKTESKYMNGEWVITHVYNLYENVWLLVYQIEFNEDKTFDKKKEIQYDNSGNEQTTISTYINEEWVVTLIYKMINNMKYDVLAITLNEDKTFYSKMEYEYDENNNWTLMISSKYVDNDWVYDRKWEQTYDMDGKPLMYTVSEYIKDNWVETGKSIKINNELKEIYRITLNEDKTFHSEQEFTYDENGNEISKVWLNYIDNSWVYQRKEEYTYDENGRCLIRIDSHYNNGTWKYDFKWEDSYDAEGNVTSVLYHYENDEWVLSTL